MGGPLQQTCDLYLQDGFWKLRWHEDAIGAQGEVEPHWPKSEWIGPATGPQRLTEEEAKQVAWDTFLSRPPWNAPPPESIVTIAEFVENHFVPAHVAKKGLAGRTHFQAILKHVLTPEEVDHAFGVHTEKSKAKLKALPDWPYLSRVRLCDARTEDVQRLISAAVVHGYSAQTVKHIRNAISAIFTHAKREHCFTGDNPASLVTLPEMIRKAAHVLTLAQAKQVLAAMRYPEKEMTLLTIFTGMSVAEICGLQWKRVNLTDAWSNMVDGSAIPPRTIAVRERWYLGELGSAGRKSRDRNLPIPEPILSMMLGLSRRAKFNGPDDLVLVSRYGTPIDGNSIRVRRLRPIGRDLQMPCLLYTSDAADE